MTVCIAAACWERGKYGIVLCHDWQGTVESVGSSDGVDKQRFIGHGWIAMVAGEMPRGDELVGMLEDVLPEFPSSDEAIRLVREKVFDFRKRMLDEYLLGTCGIGFDRFISEGNRIYPQSVFDDIHRGIMDVRLGVDMIVTGFARTVDEEDGKPYFDPCIIQVCEGAQGSIRVSLQDAFTCIGEGASSAQATLLYREHDRFDNIKETTFKVFEAKTMAEIIPTVGPTTSMYLQLPKQPLAYLTQDGYGTCNDLFKEFGPRSITRKGLKKFPITKESFKPDSRSAARSVTLRRGLLGSATTPSGSQTSEDQQ
jgi:hypothetical protein